MHFGFIFFARDLIRGVASTARLAEAQGYDLLGIDDSPALAHDAFLVFAIARISSALLAHGFLRVRCNDCAHEKLVAFSCKRRGFCSSCGARRMAETAGYLVHRVITRVPVRQARA